MEPEKKKVTWGPCTPPPTPETLSKNISASTRSSSIEIAGLLKKKKKMKKKMAGDLEIAYGQILAWIFVG